MKQDLTRVYPGSDLSGATAEVVYLPVVRAATLEKVSVRTDAAQSGEAVFEVRKNGTVIAGLAALTIASGAKIGSVGGLSVALADGDEIVLNMLSGNASAPVTLNLGTDDGLSAGEPNDRLTTAEAFGDSITNGVGASDSAHRYADLIAAAKDWTLTNHAANGEMIADQIALIYAAAVNRTGQNFWLQIGTNDAQKYGANAALRDVFQSAHLAALSYLAIPDGRNKFNARSTRCTYSGSGWSNTPVNALGKMSATNGDSVTFKVSGKTVFIGYIVRESSTAKFNITIDGVSKNALDCFVSGNPDLGTINNSAMNYTAQLARFDGLTDSEHTIVLTVAGSTGTEAFFDWAAGSSDVRREQPPIVWCGNVPRLTAAGYTTYSGSDAQTAAYNNLIAENIAVLQSDGLQIVAVDTTGAIDPVTDLGGDGLHPNDAGHQKIADAFLFAMTSQPIAPLAPTQKSDAAPIVSASAYVEITRRNLVNITEDTNGATKTGTNGWNAGFFSNESITDEGAMRYVVGNFAAANKMIGLSATDTNAGYANIDFAWFVIKTGAIINIFESGTQKLGSDRAAAIGDVLEIRIIRDDYGNRKAHYFHNKELVYISTAAPTVPLFVDTSIEDVGGIIGRVHILNGII